MRHALSCAVFAAALAAGTTVSEAAATPALEGTAWELATLSGRKLLPGTQASLRFQDGRGAGSDGCNRFSLAVSAKDGQFSAGTPAASTQRACPPPVMQQAEATLAALGAAKSYRLENGQLVLLDAGGKPLATWAPQSQLLVGTRWRATGINNGRGAVVSLVSGSTVTLEFGPDGLLNGNAGCNPLRGRYEQSGEALRLQAPATGRMSCPNPQLMEQEAAFLKALESVATARREGNRLELRTADGAMAAGFVREGD